jgi:hypothetical protein
MAMEACEAKVRTLQRQLLVSQMENTLLRNGGTESMAYVRHIQLETPPSTGKRKRGSRDCGSFPHFYQESVEANQGEEGLEGEDQNVICPIIVSRKYIRVSGQFVACLDEHVDGPIRSSEAFNKYKNWNQRGAETDEQTESERREETATEPQSILDKLELSEFKMHEVNTSALFPASQRSEFGLRIEIVNATTGKVYREEHDYPGKAGPDNITGQARPFLIWKDGDTRRDSIFLSRNDSTWSATFRFPHLSGPKGFAQLWKLRFSPDDDAVASRYPGLSFETRSFRCISRTKDK